MQINFKQTLQTTALASSLLFLPLQAQAATVDLTAAFVKVVVA